MTPYYRDENVSVYAGDCLEVMANLADESVDAVVTDPPYGLEFMGVAWDTMRDNGKARARNEWGDFGSREHARHPSEVAHINRKKGVAFGEFSYRWAVECLRLLKPGGHLLAFGGTRTHHRLACAVEDAGFEIRDSIAWLYGSGFPKSLDVSKAIDKAAGVERDILGPSARHVSGKPEQRTAGLGGSSTFAETVGMGAVITAPSTDAAKQWQGWGTALKPAFEPIVVARKPLRGAVAANVVEHGTGALNIDACRVAHNEAIKPVKAQENYTKFYGQGGRHEATTDLKAAGRWPANVVIDDTTATEIDKQSGITRDGVAVMRNHRPDTGGYGSSIWYVPGAIDAGYGGAGGASRFFPTFCYEPKAPATERPSANGVSHPTVKPLDLMRWLVRLVTPPGGLVLDPFAGSGTTAEACIHEHKRAVVIEREPDYLPLILARLTKPMAVGFNFEEPA